MNDLYFVMIQMEHMKILKNYFRMEHLKILENYIYFCNLIGNPYRSNVRIVARKKTLVRGRLGTLVACDDIAVGPLSRRVDGTLDICILLTLLILLQYNVDYRFMIYDGE